MSEAKLKINLLTGTLDPLSIINIAGHLCYSNKSIKELSTEFFTDPGIANKSLQFIKDLIDKGHHSVLEHVSFTFGIEGISRACSHQLVRHRIGVAFSQRSQRYVSEKQFDYIIPDSIKKHDKEDMGIFFNEKMKQIQEWYDYLIENGVHKEDARYLLPNACETSLVMTMNVRELYHFFTVRCCTLAQHEIRNMATEILRILKKTFPDFFNNIGPNCVNSVCKEGKRSCGKQDEIKIKFNNLH